MARYLYSEIAAAVEARRNCVASGNKEWFEHWTERIRELARLLPHGSGIDGGTLVDLDASHAEKLVLTTSFHHMNDGGYYDGWTDHVVTVTPSFRGINLRISGRDRNQIKDYLYETFDWSLKQEVPELDATHAKLAR